MARQNCLVHVKARAVNKHRQIGECSLAISAKSMRHFVCATNQFYNDADNDYGDNKYNQVRRITGIGNGALGPLSLLLLLSSSSSLNLQYATAPVTNSE